MFRFVFGCLTLTYLLDTMRKNEIQRKILLSAVWMKLWPWLPPLPLLLWINLCIFLRATVRSDFMFVLHIKVLLCCVWKIRCDANLLRAPSSSSSTLWACVCNHMSGCVKWKQKWQQTNNKRGNQIYYGTLIYGNYFNFTQCAQWARGVVPVISALITWKQQASEKVLTNLCEVIKPGPGGLHRRSRCW